MSNSALPESFKDLEPFVTSWALATETERNQRRLSSSMSEVQAFYDVMLPRMEAVLSYLNQFPLEHLSEQAHALPEQAQRLFFLALAMAEVAPAVEMYQHPRVIDGFDARRFVPDHDVTKR